MVLETSNIDNIIQLHVKCSWIFYGFNMTQSLFLNKIAAIKRYTPGYIPEKHLQIISTVIKMKSSECFIEVQTWLENQAPNGHAYYWPAQANYRGYRFYVFIEDSEVAMLFKMCFQNYINE